MISYVENHLFELAQALSQWIQLIDNLIRWQQKATETTSKQNLVAFLLSDFLHLTLQNRRNQANNKSQLEPSQESGKKPGIF
ncbi:unnamed protein product [Clonostachys rosea f. rosea IK726]|uniref:Uncharacterized protein n=1 Tax=Clonostachys rosea f. rosea IK726 TaxID=1349383 RepID=A0ACA9TG70_BIOOC|nr:unnamed protein product [Clonostachys rosea f. rosea IK726]